ncbi:GNAT family N-acetyltransferase [Echinimonas agarilytica]|uniref:GNAT family N-acetyltransferase n=1 Tax=Echinimonas agarilytica TaxID=1215918 RepID=A0AA41W8F8_9GAMM|nr:GNAT family N-acetyltransferase [Echinimonas agarilytica]MCM2680373.1 GNAT family N-acetyltransferase [Echinimonas agarilytica]
MERWQHKQYVISTDKNLLNQEAVYDFISDSYWAKNIPRVVVERSIDGSLCFGVYCQHDTALEQIGFARVITDSATFAYLSDVFVLHEHRGQGLSKWLMRCIDSHPDLQGLRRFMLATQDAHGLYQQFGFETVADASTLMMRHQPNIYAVAD